MSKLVDMTVEDRMRYHEALLSDEATLDDLVYTWDFFMEMAVYTKHIIMEKELKNRVNNGERPK